VANISNKKPSRRDAAYYKQRQRNRVFSELVNFFSEEAEQGRITKKELADSVGKDPSQISRWFAAPSNFELDTLSDLLLAMGAEMDHRIVRFRDRVKPNYAHPLVARAINQGTSATNTVPSPSIRMKPQTATSKEDASVKVVPG
jgi:hypothetical protein